MLNIMVIYEKLKVQTHYIFLKNVRFIYCCQNFYISSRIYKNWFSKLLTPESREVKHQISSRIKSKFVNIFKDKFRSLLILSEKLIKRIFVYIFFKKERFN